MRILAINGSPTPKEESITELVLSQFLSGCCSAGATVEVAHLADKRIIPCDCGHLFVCWVKTPGRCIHHDEDQVYEILQQMISADVIVLATPLYLESMTGQMKTLLDRTLPLVQPYIEASGDESRHPLRFLKEGVPFVLVSVCGHHEVSHFSALVHTIERVARNLHGRLVGKILRPHAMLLRDGNRIGDQYHLIMNALSQAGEELVREGVVSSVTEKQIQAELMPRDSFLLGANRLWRQALERREFR